jgi:beta-lactamase superfamily II metal-dependent hydrolase
MSEIVMPRNNRPIDRVTIRMYRLGTGDCFTIKFMKGRTVSFKLMIDCGCWQGDRDHVEPFMTELKRDVEDKVDALVVTHEHKDHVYGFEKCQDLFAKGQFEAKQIWMAWTEEDGNTSVEKWKTVYGQKRMALAHAAEKLRAAVGTPDFTDQLGAHREPEKLLRGRRNFIRVLAGFSELHSRGFSAAKQKQYVDGLAGMDVVKNDIEADTFSYFKPGDVIENEPGLEGVRILVLGPPLDYDDVKKESGAQGEAYEHNDKLQDVDAFALAFKAQDEAGIRQAQPFDDFYQSTEPTDRQAYDKAQDKWRRIDYDWLLSAGALALRMNSRTNNLSLVLAIEFIDSGKVLLFPGDAEYSSWKSWQSIDWSRRFPGLTTEKLLNRVVFYKVSHHLSHNGTARTVGLHQMTSPDLTAMATLDYSNIASGWKSTMPNGGVLKDLLERTMGRTLVMNTANLLFDRETEELLKDKIEEYRVQMSAEERADFEASVEETQHYISYTLDV